MSGPRESNPARDDLVVLLSSIARPGVDLTALDDNTDLVQAGVIDSLAVIQIISHLEQHHGIELRAQAFDPNDLWSISGILGVIDRAGR